MVSRSRAKAATTSNGAEKEPDSPMSKGAGKTDSQRSKGAGNTLLKSVLTKTSRNRSQTASLQDISNRTDTNSLRNNESKNTSNDLSSSSLDTTGKKRGAALAAFRAFQEQETPRTTMQNFIDVHEESAVTPAAFFSKQNRPSEGASYIKSVSAINASELISDSSNLEQEGFSAADISSDVSSIEAGPSKRRGQRKRKAAVTADEMDPGKDITQPLNKSNKTLDITDQVSDTSSLDETARVPRNKRKNRKKFEPSDFDFSMPLPPPEPKNKLKASNSTKLDISDMTDLSMDESMEAVIKIRQRKQSRKKKAVQISVADFSVAAPDEEEEVESKVDDDTVEDREIREEMREKTTCIDSSMDESIDTVAKIRERKKSRKKKAVEINATEFSVAVPEEDEEEQVEENKEELLEVRAKGEKSKNDDSTFTDLSQFETPVHRKPRVRRRKTEVIEADFSGIMTPACTPVVHQEVVVNVLSDLADIEKVGEAFKDRGSFNISEAELHKMLTPESWRLVQPIPITTDSMQNESIMNGVSQLGPRNQQVEMTGASELSFSRLSSPERGVGRRGRIRTEKTTAWDGAFDDIPGPDKTHGDPVPKTTDPVPNTTDPVPNTTDPVPNTTDPVPNTTDPVPNTTDLGHESTKFADVSGSETTLISVPGQTQNLEDPTGISASPRQMDRTLTDQFQINDELQSATIPLKNSLQSSSSLHEETPAAAQARSLEEQNFSLELSSSPPLQQPQNDYKRKSDCLDTINSASAAEIISNEGIDFDEISRLAANIVEPGFEVESLSEVVDKVPGDVTNRISDVTDRTNDVNRVSDVANSTRGVENRTSDVTNRTSNVTNFDVVTMSPATVRSPTSIMSPGSPMSSSRMSSGTGLCLGTEMPLETGMSPYRDLEDSDSIVSRPIPKSKRRKVQIDVDDFDIDNVDENPQQNDQIERFDSISTMEIAANDDYENQFKKFLHQDPSKQEQINGNAMIESGEIDNEYEEASDKIVNFEELKARRAARKSEVLGHLVRAPNLSNIHEESENPSSRFSTETNGRFSTETNGRLSTETSSRLSAGDRLTTEYIKSRTATPLSPTKEVNESASSVAREVNSSEETPANEGQAFSQKDKVVGSGTMEKQMASVENVKDLDTSNHSTGKPVEANVHTDSPVKSTNENSIQNPLTRELIQEVTTQNEDQEMTQQNTTQNEVQNTVDSKLRRKSVYQAGLPESQQNLCDDTVYEPGYFLPNVESTRLGNMTGLVDVSPISTPSAPTHRRSAIAREAVDANIGTEEADGVNADREAEAEDHADGPTIINEDVTKASQRRSIVSSTAISEKVLSEKAFPEKVSPIHAFSRVLSTSDQVSMASSKETTRVASSASEFLVNKAATVTNNTGHLTATNNTVHSTATHSTQPSIIDSDQDARNSTLPITSNSAQIRNSTLPSTNNSTRAAENSRLQCTDNGAQATLPITSNSAQIGNSIQPSTNNRTQATENSTLPSTDNSAQVSSNAKLSTSSNRTEVTSSVTLPTEQNGVQTESNANLSTSNGAQSVGISTLSTGSKGPLAATNISQPKANNVSSPKATSGDGESSFAPIVNTPSPRSRSKYEPMVASPLIRLNRSRQFSGKSSHQLHEKSTNSSELNEKSARRSIDKSTGPLQQDDKINQSSEQADEKSNRSVKSSNQSVHVGSETAQTQIWENHEVSISTQDYGDAERHASTVNPESQDAMRHMSMTNQHSGGAERLVSGSTQDCGAAEGLMSMSTQDCGATERLVSVSTQDCGDAERLVSVSIQDYGDAERRVSVSTQDCGAVERLMSVSTQDCGATERLVSVSTQDYGAVERLMSVSTQDCGAAERLVSVSTRDFGNAERLVSVSTQDYGDAERRVGVSTQDYGDTERRVSMATQDYEDASVQCYETPEYLRETRRSIKNKSLKHSLYLSKLMEDDIAEGGTQTTPTVTLERLSLDQIERMRKSVMSETACQVTPSLAANPGLSKTMGHILSSEVNMSENVMSKSIAACGGDEADAQFINDLEKSIAAISGVVDDGKSADDFGSEAIELGEAFDDDESEGSEAIGVQPKLSASFNEDTNDKWFGYERVESYLKTQEGTAKSSFMEVISNKTSPTVAELLPSRRAAANKDNIVVSVQDKHSREDDERTKGDNEPSKDETKISDTLEVNSIAESDVDNEIAIGKCGVEHSQTALDTTEEQCSENGAESVIASSIGDRNEAVTDNTFGEKISNLSQNSRRTSEEDIGDNMKPNDGTNSSNENDASKHSLPNVENVDSSNNDGQSVQQPEMCSENSEMDADGRGETDVLEESRNEENNIDANTSEVSDVFEKLGKSADENLREGEREDNSNNEGEQFEDNDTQEVPVEDNDTHEVAERNQPNKKDKLLRQATLDRYIGVQDKTADVGISQLVTPSVPAGPSKAKKPPRKKPTPAPKTVFPAKNIKFDFQRFSRYKVKKDAEETLCNASQDFMDMVMARLEAIVRKRGASKIHLCDIKQVMVECGFIPKNDDRNLQLYDTLRKTIRQDAWMELIPRAVGDGTVYPPQDCWEDTGLTKKRKRKSKSSGSSQEDEPAARKKKTSASNVKRFKVPRPAPKPASKSNKQSEEKEAVYSKNGGKGRKSRK